MYKATRIAQLYCVVFTVLTIAITEVRTANFQTCGPEELAQCAKSLSTLTDMGLNHVKNKEQLDTMCPDLDKSLSCIYAYSRLCMNLQQRKHFRKLFHGTGSMIRDICSNGTYQDDYLFHAPCLQRVSSKTEVCFIKYSEAMTQIQTATNRQKELEEAAIRNSQQYYHHRHNNTDYDAAHRHQEAERQAANEGLKNMCCAFREYVDCSTHFVRRSCGDEAALFSRGFLNKMSSSMIKTHCMDYGVEDCREKGYYEGYYSNSPHAEPYTAALSFLTIAAMLLR